MTRSSGSGRAWKPSSQMAPMPPAPSRSMRSAARSRRRARSDRPRASSMRSSSRYTARKALASGASGRCCASCALSHPAEANSSMVVVSDGVEARGIGHAREFRPAGRAARPLPPCRHTTASGACGGSPAHSSTNPESVWMRSRWKTKPSRANLILQVLRQRGGGHEQADGVVSGAHGLAKASRMNGLLPEPAGPVSNRTAPV